MKVNFGLARLLLRLFTLTSVFFIIITPINSGRIRDSYTIAGEGYNYNKFDSTLSALNILSNKESTKLLYVSKSGSFYLSTDKGTTFKKVDAEGNTIKDKSQKEVGCDITYLGLNGGGFFDNNLEKDTNYTSNKYNAQGILMNKSSVTILGCLLLYVSKSGSFYLSTDKGTTFKKVDAAGNPIKDKSGKEVGCDITYLGLNGGGFFEYPFGGSISIKYYLKYDNNNNFTITTKPITINVYTNTLTTQADITRYCIGDKFNKDILGNWISTDGTSFTSTTDNKLLRIVDVKDKNKNIIKCLVQRVKPADNKLFYASTIESAIKSTFPSGV